MITDGGLNATREIPDNTQKNQDRIDDEDEAPIETADNYHPISALVSLVLLSVFKKEKSKY